LAVYRRPLFEMAKSNYVKVGWDLSRSHVLRTSSA
jgi:hypothetical protein